MRKIIEKNSKLIALATGTPAVTIACMMILSAVAFYVVSFSAHATPSEPISAVVPANFNQAVFPNQEYDLGNIVISNGATVDEHARLVWNHITEPANVSNYDVLASLDSGATWVSIKTTPEDVVVPHAGLTVMEKLVYTGTLSTDVIDGSVSVEGTLTA